MIFEGSEHQATCVDIAFSGIQVVARAALKVARGEAVTVRIDLGAESFQDRYQVEHSQHTVEGTALHLGQ